MLHIIFTEQTLHEVLLKERNTDVIQSATNFPNDTSIQLKKHLNSIFFVGSIAQLYISMSILCLSA